jgi:hypothetical protein
MDIHTSTLSVSPRSPRNEGDLFITSPIVFGSIRNALAFWSRRLKPETVMEPNDLFRTIK